MTSGVGIRTPTLGIRILGLVVESGMLYIFIGVSSACLVHGHCATITGHHALFVSSGHSFGLNLDLPALRDAW